MKRAIVVTFAAAILVCVAALPADARGAAGGGCGGHMQGSGWHSGYGCASGLRRC